MGDELGDHTTDEARDGAHGRDDPAGSPHKRVTVQSIDRAVQILRCFDGKRRDIGISELAQMTGLSTSTVHRLLTSMVDNDLVRQTTHRRYGLGPLVAELGRRGGMSTTLLDVALGVAKPLCDEVDETVGIHELLPNGRRAVVGQVESRQELRRTYTEFGVPLALPHGAPGKAMLAYLPEERREWWLSQPIDAATPSTIADPAALRTQLVEIRERGWAYSDAERTAGIRAVAAPVFDHTGAVVGALGLSVPMPRMPVERVAVLGERIRRAAAEVSGALGAPVSQP